MQSSTLRLAAIFVGLAVIGVVVWIYFNPSAESNPIVVDDEERVVVLPFSEVNNFEDPPVGWTHEQFWMVNTMALANLQKDGKQALRCETKGDGSILTRTTDIDIWEYPTLVWDWFIEFPISSPIDEATVEGDDHPVRLLLSVEDQSGGLHEFQIIWGNRDFEPGTYKQLGGLAHFVANGLDENTRVWQHQEVDLMQVYRDITGREDYPTLKSIGLHCDSNDTNSRSVAFITDVALEVR